MRQAKWLLIAAVAIFLILPGCKSMNPTGHPEPGVNTATVSELIGTWDLLAGVDQVKIGTATMSWQYDSYDPSKTGNDKFVNLKLRIEFHADDPHTFDGDAQVNVSLEKPTEKGAPGQYNAFKAGFQVTPYPDDQTRIYLIPVSWLEAQPPAGVGWQCGGHVWFLWHTAGDFGTAMAGEFVKPRKGAWFNRLGMYLCNPTETPPQDQPDPWDGTTRTRGYWKRFWRTTDGGNPPQWWTPESVAKYLPQTCAGVTYSTPAECYDLFDTPSNSGMWVQFQAQFLAAKLNAVREPDLPNAYYNYPGVGEWMENWQVSAIFARADGYGTTMPPAYELEATKTVLDNINNYNDNSEYGGPTNNCLWDAPWTVPYQAMR